MRKDFEKTAEKDLNKELEIKIETQEKELKAKNDKISSIKNELYNSTEELDKYKLEQSKLRDNLSETSNELMIERNKLKLLTETTVSNSIDIHNDLKSVTDHNLISLENT